MMLGKWDRYSHRLADRWGAVGVTELPTISPFYNENAHHIGCDWRVWLHYLVSLCAVVGAVVVMFICSLVVMSIEVLIQTTPLCGTWFYETVWKEYVAIGGKYQSDSTNTWGQ